MRPRDLLVPRSPLVMFAGIAAACLFAAATPAHAQAGGRQLVAVTAPAHDPLFVDAASVQRRGSLVSFKYLLDVRVPSDDAGAPAAWKSNEVEASIDCGKRTVAVRRLVAYSGPGGSGSPTGVHSFTAPGAKPERIAPKSTFAYLESHLCRDG